MRHLLKYLINSVLYNQGSAELPALDLLYV